MREILFRGKRVDNGEWVEGYLFLTTFSTVKYMALNPCIQVVRNDVYYCSYEVIRETIGQFTGLTDKNGARIFEGDICKTHDWKKSPDGSQTLSEKNKYFYNVEIKYNEKHPFPGYIIHDWYEIIGNIHDNPELLTK